MPFYFLVHHCSRSSLELLISWRLIACCTEGGTDLKAFNKATETEDNHGNWGLHGLEPCTGVAAECKGYLTRSQSSLRSRALCSCDNRTEVCHGEFITLTNIRYPKCNIDSFHHFLLHFWLKLTSPHQMPCTFNFATAFSVPLFPRRVSAAFFFGQLQSPEYQIFSNRDYQPIWF